MSLPRDQADVAPQKAGVTAESHALVIGGTDPNGLVTQLLTDASGKVEVTGGAANLPTVDASTGGLNATAPLFGTQVGGQDGSGKLQALKVDSSGNLLVAGGTGGGSGTQYADGATQATPTGTVALGKNGSNIVHALSLDGSGNLNVNLAAGTISGGNAAASATGSPVPASGDYIAAKDGSGNLVGLSASANGLKVDGSAVTQPVSGTVTANQGGTWTVQPGNTANTTAWKVDGSAVTQPVSGSITANIGTSGSLALDASVTGLTVAQASTTSGQKGHLVQGAVTTAAPTYTTAQTNPLSLDTAGLLRVSIKDTPQNTTAFKVDGSAVTQPVSIAATVAVTESGTWNIGSSTATGSAVPANAFYKAGIAKTALPAAASDGNLTGAMVDKFGRQVCLLGSIRDLTGTQTTTLSASTSETTIVTAGAAGIFNDLVMLIVSNTSAATNTRIDFRDTTAGTVLFSLESIGGAAPVGFALPIPVPQTSAATNWTAQCATSTTDVRIYAVFVKNK